MYRVAYRNFGDHESLVLNHSVDTTGTRLAGVRWYEVRSPGATTPTVFQQGTYAPSDPNYRWMGSIAMDKEGNIALGFSISGSTLKPGIRYTGRYLKIERIKPIQRFNALTQLIWLVQRSIAFQFLDQPLQGRHHHSEQRRSTSCGS